MTITIKDQTISVLRYIQQLFRLKQSSVPPVERVVWLDGKEELSDGDVIIRLKKGEDDARYEALFTYYQQLERASERYEVVLGLGYLQTETFARHVLTTPVQLDFYADRGEFVVRFPKKAVSWTFEERAVLTNEQVVGSSYQQLATQWTTPQSWHTVDEQLDRWLQSFVHLYDVEGTFEKERSSSFERVVISRSPALLLRKRVFNAFDEACKVAIEQVATTGNVPPNLRALFEKAEIPAMQRPERFYFPLPTNDEQRRILETLYDQPNVLVQGPPGTGKTHSIANIAAHLVATGNRVLITSETPKALRVLKDKLPEDYQPFFVEVLEQNDSLERVVETIINEKDTFDREKLEEDIQILERQVDRVEEEIRQTQRKLLELRAQEGLHHQINRLYHGTPEEIARCVVKEAASFHWYPFPEHVTEGMFEKERESIDQWFDLRKQLDFVSEGATITTPLPETMDWEKFQEQRQQEKEQYEQLKPYESSLVEAFEKPLFYLSSGQLMKFDDQLTEGEKILQTLHIHMYPTIGNALDAVFEENIAQVIALRDSLQLDLERMERYALSFKEELVTVPEGLSVERLEAMTDDLMSYLKEGGKLKGLIFTPKRVRPYEPYLEQMKYNDVPITRIEQLKRIDAYAKTNVARSRISRQVPDLCTDVPLALCIERTREYVGELTKVIQFAKWRESLRTTYDFLQFSSLQASTLQTLHDNVRAVRIMKQMQFVTMAIDTFASELKQFGQQTHTPLYVKYSEAIEARDEEKMQYYAKLYEEGLHAFYLRQQLEEVEEQLREGNAALLTLMKNSYGDEKWQERLDIHEERIAWCEAKLWLEAHTLLTDEEEKATYERLYYKRQQLLQTLGAKKTWHYLITSITPEASKHLKGWMQAVRRMREEKDASPWVEQAEEHMKHCQHEVPAWIMPLHTVFEQFSIRPNLFDVVIIDEASQSWHDALLLHYIAKRVIIVGDDEQISPSIIGVRQKEVEQLQTKHFASLDLPFVHLLDLNHSYFDFAYTLTQQTITLREHFRCMPEIIGFSNQIAYPHAPLYPLRTFTNDRLPPIQTVYVEGAERKKKVNKKEGKALLERVEHMLRDPRYDGKTFGIISLTGNEQAEWIEKQLRQRIPEEEIIRRRLIAGDAYTFQGDERDIILLSMVVTKDETLRAQTQKQIYERYNVATSRARDQLWVFHSVLKEDIDNPECLRYQLLTYCENVPVIKTAREDAPSTFTVDIYDILTENNYTVYPSYPVAKESIDLVVEKDGRRTALFCRSAETSSDMYELKRQWYFEQMLRRAGWRVVTIRASSFYRDVERGKQQLMHYLSH